MKAQDLRVGNLIKYTNAKDLRSDLIGTIISVDSSVIGFIESVDRPDFYESIPLSPSVLEAIDWGGFTNLSLNSYFKIDDVGHVYYCGDYTGLNVSYLHDLQNLKFVITGTELTIDINKLK